MKGHTVTIGVCTAAALVVGGATWASASIPSTTTKAFSGCRNKATGALRVVDAQALHHCTTAEVALTWNQAGPRGPVGQRGPAGAAGARGATGATGARGAAGATGTGMRSRGVFLAINITYAMGDVVRSGTSSWVATQAVPCVAARRGCTSPAPGSLQGAAYWKLLASDGANGLPGAPGTNGTNGVSGLTLSTVALTVGHTLIPNQSVANTAKAQCPAGTRVIAGGYRRQADQFDQSISTAFGFDVAITNNAPDLVLQAWDVTAVNRSILGDATMMVFAECAIVP